MFLRERLITRTIKASEVRRHWSQVINAVAWRKIRVIVERSGIPVAAIISLDELERFDRLEAAWNQPFAALDRTRAAFDDVPEDELEAQVRTAVAEARAELRAEREQGVPRR